MVRTGLIVFIGVVTVIACSSRPPKPKIIYVHRKHPKKSADTIPLGPPYINLKDPAVICAKRFVRAMFDNDQRTAKEMISPEWLRETDRSISDFMVSRLDITNTTPHTSCVITDVRNDTVFVQPLDAGYLQPLMLKISREGGKTYIEPSGADDCCGSIDPWTWPPDPYPCFPMHERARPPIYEDGQMVTCVRRFVRAMLKNDQRSAMRMLSPRWLKKNGINMDTFIIGRSGLVEVPPRTPFKVVDSSGYVISVLTAPNSDNEQRLSVRTSYENGRYYIEPAGADNISHSISPWASPTEH